MQTLATLIRTLEKEDIRFFKLWANRYGYNTKERKDLQLLDLLRAEKTSEEEIYNLLYPDGDKNSFYRLKNRLAEDLNQTYWMQHYAKDTFTHTMYLYTLARLHYKAKRQETALSFLQKAEKQAKQTENIELLDLIYHQFIQIAIETSEFAPDTYILLRKANRKKLEALHELEDTLARVVHQIHASLNTRSDVLLLEELQQKIEGAMQIFQSGVQQKWRFRVYEAIIRILLQKNDFITMENYLLETYTSFQAAKLFTKDHHEIKLSMLTYLVNTLNRNQKYILSLEYAEKLKLAMQEYQNLYYDKYEFFYYNALYANYFELDKNRATEILLTMKKLAEAKPLMPFNILSIHLNLAFLYFQQAQHRKVIRALQDLYLAQEYKIADISLRLKVLIFELVCRFEQKDWERMEERASQIRKQFAVELLQETYQKDAAFIVLLLALAEEKQDTKLLVQSFLKTYPDEAQDHQFFHYKDWLTQKFEG